MNTIQHGELGVFPVANDDHPVLPLLLQVILIIYGM